MSTTTLSSSSAALVGNSNDLVGEILSRLPLSSVVRCRWVCKEWCSLTSTQSFIDMHENNINQQPAPPCSNSCFVVQYLEYNTLFFNLDTSKSDHINTLFFNLDNGDNNNNNNTMKKMKIVREYIDLSRSNIFSSRVDDDDVGEDDDDEDKNNTYSCIRNKFFHKIKTYYHIKLMSSCRGFLLFTAKPAAAANNMSVSARFRAWLTSKHKHKQEEEEEALILYNPVTKEQHTVTCPNSTYVYCGFYYHSPTKEYRLLYQHMFNPHLDADMAGFVKFLVFGLQTYRTKTIIQFVTSLDSLKYYAAYICHPDTSTPHVISNGSLHWIVSEDDHPTHHLPISLCSNTILTFGMESEKFSLMPHPKLFHPCSPSGPKQHCHHMNLLEMEGGILCLCDGHCKCILVIYVMEDYKKWTWVRRYRIDLGIYDLGNDQYYFLRKYRDCEYGLHYKALQILQGGDQLLLHYHSDRFDEEYVLYSLNQVDIKKIDLTDKKKKIYKRQPSASAVGNMVVLTPSLASFQHNYDTSAAPPPGSNDTLFSLRTNTSYHLFN